MDIWSILCRSNIAHRNPSRSPKMEVRTPSRGSSTSSASAKRQSFSAGRKSFPSASLLSKDTSTDRFCQYSMEDVIMQNNCTVIDNKVGPVIIKNCKEEYQMRPNERNVTGRLHEQSSEHELLLDKFFLLKDHFIGVDRHDTLEEHGVPNLRVIESSPTVYAIGQPTRNGLDNFTKSLLKKHQIIYYINVRAVPTLFLRRSGDFHPYSAFTEHHQDCSKLYETERELHDAEREIQLQALRIASSNSGMFYYYNVLDTSPNEPHMYATEKMDDLLTSRQLFAKIQSEHNNFKYKRMVLADIEEPPAEWLDSLINVVKEIRATAVKDSAIVFQGLTGEGPATLAALFASLSSCNTLERSDRWGQAYDRVRKIEAELPWRVYVVEKMLNSSKLPAQTLRKQVNMTMAKICTIAALENVSSEIKSYKDFWTLLGSDSTKAKESNQDDRTGKPAYTRAGSNGSIALRDMSELSLCKSKNGEQKESQHIRHEVCDEERLQRMIFFEADLYYYLLVFRAYVLEQASLLFPKSFSRWLVHNPGLVFDLSQARSGVERIKESKKWQLKKSAEKDCDIALDPTFHRIVGTPIFGIAQTTQERFEKLVLKLCGRHAKKSYAKVQFINVREESSFYSGESNQPASNGENDAGNISGSRWELQLGAIPCMYGARADMIEEVEERVQKIAKAIPDRVALTIEDGTSVPYQGFIQTTKDVITDISKKESIAKICDGIHYKRIPFPCHRIPRFQCFDELVETVRNRVEEPGDAAFVFFCHNGKRRTTNSMVAACLILSHMEKFELDVENCSTNTTDLWAPDVEFTRGEYKVVLELIQILPDCHLRKKEVDAALDLCYESMSTMHYHLREHLNPSFKKAKKATNIVDYLTLKHRSYLALEFYVFLILFNAYLCEEKKHRWRKLSFNDWMTQHAARLGVFDILNNLGFVEFGEDYPMNLLRTRWMDTSTFCRKFQSTAKVDLGYLLKSNGEYDSI